MLQVIYIPGLGDARVTGQRLAVRSWRLWGVQPQLFQMNWGDGEPFEPKFKRLLQTIDAAAKRGNVALVSASAGASAAVNAFAERSNLVGIVCIAGKINNPSSVGQGYKTKSPAFWESAQQSPVSLAQLQVSQRKTILSLYARRDGIVPARDSIVEGAYNQQVATAGHALTIATQLIFGAPKFVRFLRNLDKQA